MLVQTGPYQIFLAIFMILVFIFAGVPIIKGYYKEYYLKNK